jgi:hypothetical protein
MALHVNSTSELLAAVPYLFGFHPADCVVVVALRGGSLHFSSRQDLPDADPAAIVRLVTQHRVDRVIVIGYGPATRVKAVVPGLAAGLRLAGVEVFDEVRVTDGRYWSLNGPDAQPCDLDSTVVAAAATFQGLPVLPDRAALVAQLAPVTGQERQAMSAATARAEERFRLLETVHPAGFAAVREAYTGRRLTNDDVAALGVLLRDGGVCDYAWARSEARAVDQALWMDVLRRVEPDYAPAPAALLAFVAWRLGLGPLAGIAVDRALAVHPGYEPARLMDEILRRGLDPASLESWPGRRAAA